MGQGSSSVERERSSRRRNRLRGRTSRSIVLPADLAVVRRARGLVEDVCRAADIDDDTREAAVLLASETVTNAVVHARGEATLAVTTDAGVVRVEVGDTDARHPRTGGGDLQAPDGRGLEIVRLVARRWGVRSACPGKVVWFEVGTPLGA